jgi:hypothetical protein
MTNDAMHPRGDGAANGLDADVAAMLERRSTRGTADDLRGPIAAAVSTTRQQADPVGRLAAAFRATRWPRILVFAVVASGLIGGAILVGGSRPSRTDAPILAEASASAPTPSADRPDPTPAETAKLAAIVPQALPSAGPAARGLSGWLRTGEFARAFSYVVPADLEGLRLVSDSAYVYGLVRGDDPLWTGNEDWGTEGIAVGHLAGPVVHPCPWGGSRAQVHSDPQGLADDLLKTGVTATKVGTVTVDGHEGIAFDLQPGACDVSDLHMADGLSGGKTIPLTHPARMIVLRVGETPLVIVVWAASGAALQQWLPAAEQLIASIRFRD